MSHTALLTVDALQEEAQSTHPNCGTQRGGANSDALAKFQFRDVGLLVILIGNVHHFPFFLLLSVQTTQICSFAPIPNLQDTDWYCMGQVHALS